MEKDIVFTLFYVGAFFSFRKYFKTQAKIKQMQRIKCKCSDVIVRQTYNKKFYIFYYESELKGELSKFIEQKRIPIFNRYIKINNEYLMFVNVSNDKEYVGPIETFLNKYYLILSIVLIVLPLVIFKY